MSKTTFDPKAKAFVGGESPEGPKETGTGPSGRAADRFEKVEGISWKAFSSAENPLRCNEASPLDLLKETTFALDDALKRGVDVGILGGAKPLNIGPRNQFDLSIQKAAPKEYLKYFSPVELPPSLAEAITLFPNEADTKSLQSSIVETRTLYLEKLQELTDRKFVLDNILKSGKVMGKEADIVRQQIAALGRAMTYTQEQIDDLERYEKAKVGDGSAI